METRRPRDARSRRGFSSCFLALLVFLAGCGAPGEPRPPSPTIPAAITDLNARQVGDSLELTFTLPARTVAGERLTAPPAVDILRGALGPDGSVDAKSFRAVRTIPGALVTQYAADGHVRVLDPIRPEDARAQAMLAYRVRTRASRKRSSPDSNTVAVQVFPTPERITSIQTEVTPTAIELTWSAPTRTSGGEPVGAIREYQVYRGEVDSSSAEVAVQDLSQARWKTPWGPIGRSQTTSYRDTAFTFGKTYVYTVRSVVLAAGQLLESVDSRPAMVTPKAFPPAPPQGLVAVVITPPGAPPEVDLSWSMNSETDLAGYHVYRSEQQDTRGQMLTSDLLLAPTYRDRSVVAGHRYWYRVTAVDHAGNESPLSMAVAADLRQPSS